MTKSKVYLWTIFYLLFFLFLIIPAFCYGTEMSLFWQDKEVQISLPDEIPLFQTLEDWHSRTSDSLELPYHVYCLGRYADNGDSYVFYMLWQKPEILGLRSCIDGKAKYWIYLKNDDFVLADVTLLEDFINVFLREWEKPFEFPDCCRHEEIPEITRGAWREKIVKRMKI